MITICPLMSNRQTYFEFSLQRERGKYLTCTFKIFRYPILNERPALGSKGSIVSVQVTSPLGSAAFSQAVEAIDIKTGAYVCLKVIKVST